MRLEIQSPPMVKVGNIADVLPRLEPIAADLRQHPRYPEPGRASWLIHVGSPEDKGSSLERFVVEMGEQFGGRPPKKGSVAFLSVVTDPGKFRREGRPGKLASFWHQEVVFTRKGIMHAPQRLIIAHEVGPYSAVGNVVFDNAVRLSPQEVNKERALSAGETVCGPDKVLIKSEVDPRDGEISQAEPGVHLLPPETVHRAADVFPIGRMFLQMDT